MQIEKATIDFLKKIKKNNTRAWFQDHKSDYQKAKTNVDAFSKHVFDKLSQSDELEFYKVHRIYRDVRFSKNKSPYKEWFSCYLKRFGLQRRGGYIFCVEPGESFVGGGFYSPNTEDLLRVRKEIEVDGASLQAIIEQPAFIEEFGAMQGEKLKTAPRGFDKDHKHIDLLRMKQLYARRMYTDQEVLQKDFADRIIHTFIQLRPFFDYMSEVLTTDMNGESIL